MLSLAFSTALLALLPPQDPLTEATKSLRSKSADKRLEALATIERLRPDLAVGCKRAKAWVCVHDHHQIHVDAANQLVLIRGFGLRAVKVVPNLDLKNANEKLVLTSLKQIIADPELGQGLTDAMLELATNESTQLRTTALRALATQDLRNEAIREALSKGRKDNSADVRRSVAAGLGATALADLAIPHLRALLQDPDENVRRIAVESLGRHGTNARKSEGEIAALVRDRIPAVRRTAIHALSMIEAQKPRSLSVIAKATTDKDHKVVIAALTALRKFGPRAMPHVASLDAPLAHEREDIRLEATRAKGAVHPDAGLTFVRMLQDPSGKVQKAAGEALRAGWTVNAGG